ncbi:plasminogen receptor (KT) [Lingula anatina]|uniref:Plasminogen receptor (KT) n=1 Tax=Lingula anatina TaxID=7574 RepID=A0A1S3IEV4_LINAN|nr:plasminogen receptor (KT) [Lingula anatina]XP_023932670.1 plasminogen receptor (KT) [Lingula anatina]|eukprot:XP_013396673.1 plasminogen receptor (KT) [Lingula anatina]
MGSILGKTVGDVMEKNQQFMLQSQQMQLERMLQQQNQMRERMMAMQIARAREMFWWWAAFYGIVVIGALAGLKQKRLGGVIPAVPLTFIVGYQYDNAYMNKLERIRAMADKIMVDEHDMLSLPHGLPTFEDIEAARLNQKEQAKK